MPNEIARPFSGWMWQGSAPVWIGGIALAWAMGGCTTPSTEDGVADDPPPAMRIGPEGEVAESPADSPETAPEPTAVEASGLIPMFTGFKPVLLEMPVPVFSDDVEFEALVPGWVDFSLQIDEYGEVIELEVLEASDALLKDPAAAALRAARFEPVRDPQGMPVRVSFRQRIEF